MAEPKYEIVNDERIDAIKDNFTPPGAKKKEAVDWNKPLFKVDEENAALLPPTRKNPKRFRKKDWNKVIGCVDENDVFQKSLDDYMNKNPKGRDDIPTVTTRR